MMVTGLEVLQKNLCNSIPQLWKEYTSERSSRVPIHTEYTGMDFAVSARKVLCYVDIHDSEHHLFYVSKEF